MLLMLDFSYYSLLRRRPYGSSRNLFSPTKGSHNNVCVGGVEAIKFITNHKRLPIVLRYSIIKSFSSYVIDNVIDSYLLLFPLLHSITNRQINFSIKELNNN